MADQPPATRSDDDPLQRFSCCGIGWIASAAGEQIVRRLENSLADVVAGRGGPPIKSNPLRRVYRLAVAEGRRDAGTPGRREEEKARLECKGATPRRHEEDACAIAEVYLKCFDERSPRAWVKRVIRGPAGRREFRRLRKAWLAGAPVPQPLACGVSRNASHLLTASCPPGETETNTKTNTNSFLDWLDAHGWDDRAAAALIDLLIATYSAGLLHDDLHVGNILYRPGEGRGSEGIPPGMWLLDLGRARLRERCRGEDIPANLAPLAAGLRGWLTEEQLETFLSGFLARANERWPGELPAEPEFLFVLRAAARKHQAAGRRHRLHGILKTNNYFARIRLPRLPALPALPWLPALPSRWTGQVFLRRRCQRIDPNSAAAGLRLSAADWIAALDRLVRPADGAGGPGCPGCPCGPAMAATLQIGLQRVEVIVERGVSRSAWPMVGVLPFVRGPATRRFRAAHAALMVDRADSGEPAKSAGLENSTALPLAAIQRRAGIARAEWLMVFAAE